MKLFTFKWNKIAKNHVVIKAIDSAGKIYSLKKRYREWIGVATNNVKQFVRHLKNDLIGCQVEVCQLDDRKYAEILPLFYDRLQTEEDKNFYKVYVDSDNYETGSFLNADNVSYFSDEQWITRIYIDVCTKFQTDSLYYKWYEIDLEEKNLIDSLISVYEQDKTLPPMKIASFDLETVPWNQVDRFPTGHDVDDVIVMISLVIGQMNTNGRVEIQEKRLYYLNPISEPLNLDYKEYSEEKLMIKDFLRDLETEESILFVTGYNINNYDLPCIFARSCFANSSLSAYTSRNIGKHVITSIHGKYTIDMYNYVLAFSPGGLPSFKLDDVAKTRLGQSKVPVHATSIHKWYQARNRLNKSIVLSDDVTECYEFIDPGFPISIFGTFKRCLEYCVVDAELVLKLIDRENAISFLFARSNMCTLDVEEVMYYGTSRYIQNVIESYGTQLGYFINLQKLRNVTEDGEQYPYISFAQTGKKKYQGALNYCEEKSFHSNVTIYDFESLYPTTIICANISYETFAVVHVNNLPADHSHLQCVPFRVHDDSDFLSTQEVGEKFQFPSQLRDLVMVSSRSRVGFLPTLLEHFMVKRRHEKALMVNDAIYHKNKQLSYKLFMNSLYGCLGAEDGQLCNLGMGMSVTCFSRYILLGAYHYLKQKRFHIPYCDTDSLFVSDSTNIILNHEVNNYLALKAINLQFEKKYQAMLIITKKRYCYKDNNGRIHAKGFEVKSNQLTKDMLAMLLQETFEAMPRDRDVSKGYEVLIDRLLVPALVASKDPVANCTTRKVKALEDYSPKCNIPHVRLMKRKRDKKIYDFINFTYLYTDVSKAENFKLNPVFADEIGKDDIVDFTKLYSTQKTNMLTLLNMAFFRFDDVKRLNRIYEKMVSMMKWKQKVNVAVMCKSKLGEDLIIMKKH